MEKRFPRRELSTIEALLFAAGESISSRDIARAVGLSEKAALALTRGLLQRMEQRQTGIQIEQFEKRFQMSSRPLYYPAISTLYKAKAQIRLTETQLEVLAIVAYQQPITRQEVSDIRGVSSDNVVNRLMQLGLVEEAGRMKAPGRPVLIKTTDEFLRIFGLSSIRELPRLPRIREDENPMQEVLVMDEVATAEDAAFPLAEDE